MQVEMKKSYSKPALTVLGSIQDVTGWFAGSTGEYFGGQKQAKVKSKGAGPADFGS